MQATMSRQVLGLPLWHLALAFLVGLIFSFQHYALIIGTQVITWEPWLTLRGGLYALGGYIALNWAWRNLTTSQILWLVGIVAVGWLTSGGGTVQILGLGIAVWVVWWLFTRGTGPRWNVYTSRWAHSRDLEVLTQPQALDGTAILFAHAQAGLLGLRPGTGNRREYGHVLFCGPTRSGKSVALSANLNQWGGSAVILDIKGELYRQTAGRRSHYTDVVLLSTEGNGIQYDPIQQLAYSDEGLRTAAEIILHSEQDREPVFAQRASLLLHATFLGAQQQGQAGIVYL